MSYAYHIKLNEDIKLGLGISAGMVQWGIDGHKLVLHDSGDENLLVQYQKVIVPDFGTGILLVNFKCFLDVAV